ASGLKLLPESLQHGFLHRLDVPSSGLLFCGLSHKAFYELKLLLAVGRVGREYLVLCHGLLAPQRLEAAVHWKDAGGAPTRCGRGKPSLTRLREAAHGFLQGEAVSLLLVALGTGRRHQIRAHLAFAGRPVLGDGKYCAQETYRRDGRWCTQNCLHRQRLRLPGLEATAPLPAEGCGFGRLLQALRAKDAASAVLLRRVLATGAA
ncbi:unnamed protein product, partial [Effrenium voratum]